MAGETNVRLPLRLLCFGSKLRVAACSTQLVLRAPIPWRSDPRSQPRLLRARSAGLPAMAGLRADERPGSSLSATMSCMAAPSPSMSQTDREFCRALMLSSSYFS